MIRPKQSSALWCFLAVTASTGAVAQPADSTPDAPQVRSAQQTPEQLQQLVAPIALYPDTLVGQILASATYPAEIVEADRWMQQHRNLKGSDLAQAVDKQQWEGSVKTLTEFPKVLGNMDKNLSWTSTLGDAYMNQQQDVMDAVQTMRQRASKSGTLQTSPEQTVTDDGNSITIQPANPQIVYVPEYDPWQVYGGSVAVYPGWTPYPGLFLSGPGLDFGLGFGFDYFAGYGWGWNNWGVDWRRRNVTYSHNSFSSHSQTFARRNNASHDGGRDTSPSVSRSRTGSPASNYTATLHGRSSVRAGSTAHPSAFSSFNHGGVVQSNSSRGQSSFGSGFHASGIGASPSGSRSGGGSQGGGSHGGGGGGGSRGGGGGRR